MAFIPAPAGVARVRYTWAWTGGAVAQNVFYYDTGTGGALTQSEVDNVAAVARDAVAAGTTPDFGPQEYMTSDFVLFSVEAEDAFDQFGKQSSLFVNQAGANSAGSTPPGTAAVVKMLTGFRGRSSRGRLFFGGLPETAVNGSGTIDSTLHGQLTSAWERWMALLNNGFTFAGGQLVVASYQVNKTARSEAQVLPVVSVSIDANTKSQRRRNLTG